MTDEKCYYAVSFRERKLLHGPDTLAKCEAYKKSVVQEGSIFLKMRDFSR